MKNGKIIILGIDGLEYDLVKEWKLKHLELEASSRLELSDFGVIITPLIWASMLTGKKEDEIERIFLERSRYFSKTSDSLKKKQRQYWHAALMARILPKSIKTWVNKKLLPDPFKKTSHFLKKNNKRTLFDFFKNPWNNGVPAYNKCVTSDESKKMTGIAINGDLKPLHEFTMAMYERDKKELFDALKKDYDLIFWYTSFLDKISHFYIVKKRKLMNIYLDLNTMVKKIREGMGPDDVLYIISDHGMVAVEGSLKAGDHSDHAYFSSSTGETIQKPQELFDIVTKRGTKIP